MEVGGLSGTDKVAVISVFSLIEDQTEERTKKCQTRHGTRQDF